MNENTPESGAAKFTMVATTPPIVEARSAATGTPFFAFFATNLGAKPCSASEENMRDAE